jgi:hypothetical protein
MSMKLIPIAGAIAVSLFWATSAGATTITIGASIDGGTINQLAQGTDFANFAGAIGGSGYTINGINGALGVNPFSFLSNSLNVATTGDTTGTLDIYVTMQGITSPTGFTSLLSTLTSNVLGTGWTENLQTYLDLGNGLWTINNTSTNPQLAAHGFNGLGTFSQIANETLTGPYSLTELFIISAPGAGTANATINISQTPLPAALPLFATGLLGFWGWSRKRKASADLADVSHA